MGRAKLAYRALLLVAFLISPALYLASIVMIGEAIGTICGAFAVYGLEIFCRPDQWILWSVVAGSVGVAVFSTYMVIDWKRTLYNAYLHAKS